jgi:hypothetical protein
MHNGTSFVYLLFLLKTLQYIRYEMLALKIFLNQIAEM